jgi:hypothetical protein
MVLSYTDLNDTRSFQIHEFIKILRNIFSLFFLDNKTKKSRTLVFFVNAEKVDWLYNYQNLSSFLVKNLRSIQFPIKNKMAKFWLESALCSNLF